MKRLHRKVRNKYKKKFCYKFYNHLFFCYHSLFFCTLIFRGHKIKAFNFFLQLKYNLKKKEQFDPNLVFLVAMLKITPDLILRPYKKSGKINYIPFPIKERKQITFAIKWVIKLLKDTKGKVSISSITEILTLAIYKKGEAIKKKREVYSEALRNRHMINYLK